jgi:hypothetical protein
MGKLIKNHWARLVILTAAACKSSRHHHHIFCSIQILTMFFRPTSRCPRSLLLAQNLLGLSHQKPRCGRKALPSPTNHQPDPRRRRARLGMAIASARRHWSAPLHRGPPDCLPALRTVRTAPLPRHKFRPVLHCRHDCVLLGV